MFRQKVSEISIEMHLFRVLQNRAWVNHVLRPNWLKALEFFNIQQWCLGRNGLHAVKENMTFDECSKANTSE